MVRIKCGHCGEHHDSVSAVRACATGRPETLVADPGEARPQDLLGPLRQQVRDQALRAFPDHTRLGVALAVPGEDNVRFFDVSMPRTGKWNGYVFLSEQAGSDSYPVRGRERTLLVLGLLAKTGVAAAVELYGQEIGTCGLCFRRLTDELSRERGIGPVCWEKRGAA